MNFKFWILKESAGNINIDYSEYENHMKNAIQKSQESHQENSERLKNFQFNPEMIKQSSYPEKEQLLAAFSSNDRNKSHYQIGKFSDWYFKNNRNSKENLRPIWKHALDTHSKISGDWEYNPDDYKDVLKNLMQETQKNMEEIKNKITHTISSIPTWNNSPVVIVPQESYEMSNHVSLSPATSIMVRVGTKEGCFTYSYHEGKPEIDDIIEGGHEDDEFFDNDNVKSDYYALINELKNPGSSQKGKMLTLFTARPTKDREFFQNATSLPINMFLTNSASHADGLAHDLGAGEVRDIWKVRMDNRFLTQTLDSMGVKYYMVSSKNAPIKSISLY